MSFLAGAVCAACESGVHDDRGRVACDGCDLPTGCCLCPPPPRAVRPAARPGSHQLALGAGRGPVRLAERIATAGCRPAPFAVADAAMPASALNGCHVMLADSVSIYAAALRARGGRVPLTQLPNLLPPTERCFVEMRGADDTPSWGAYIVTLDLGDRRVLRKMSADPLLGSGPPTPPGARWLLMSGLVVDSTDEPPMGPVLLHQLYLDELGAVVLRGRDRKPAVSASMPRLERSGQDPEHEVFKERCTRRYFMPVAFSLAFSNCEGSTLEPVGVAAAGASLTVDRLRIEPFEDALAQLARPGGSAVEAAANLVPGRFEDDRRGPTDPGSRTGVRWRPPVP